MKRLTKEQFGKMVGAMYSSWSEEYRAAFKKQRPKARLYQYRIKLNDQRKFIQFYLGMLMLDGTSSANLNRIRRFLNMQKANSRGVFEIHFVGGAPLDVVVHVDKIQEIDFADTHGLIGFDSIFITRRDKPWSRKNKNEIYKVIKDDLEFDGDTFEPASVFITNGDEDHELVFEECGIN